VDSPTENLPYDVVVNIHKHFHCPEDAIWMALELFYKGATPCFESEDDEDCQDSNDKESDVVIVNIAHKFQYFPQVKKFTLELQHAKASYATFVSSLLFLIFTDYSFSDAGP
jgi:hypothetical protein